MSATPSEATHAGYLVTIKRTSPGYWRCRRALSGPADRFDDRTTHDRGHGCTEPARVPALAGENSRADDGSLQGFLLVGYLL